MDQATANANSQAIATATNNALSQGDSVDLGKVTNASQIVAVPSATGSINSSSLKPTPAIILPTPPTAPNYSAATTGAITGATTPTGTNTVTPTGTGTNTGTGSTGTGSNGTVITPTPTTPPAQTLSQRFQGYLSGLGITTPTAPTSEVTTYNNLQTQNDIAGKQKAVNDLTASINTIKAQTDAAKLSLNGNQTGVPLAIIGGQQAELDREAAIKTLPLTAQLNAAQGNLTTATDNINTLMKLTADDNAATYKYQTDQINQAMQFANADQTQALQDKQDEIAAAAKKDADFQQSKQTYAQAAIAQGDFKTASAIATSTDDASLSAAAANIKQNPLDVQLKQAQIAEANASAAKTRQDMALTAGQLTPQQNTIVNDANSQLASNKQVQGFQETASEYQNIASIPNGTTDPTQQTMLLTSIAHMISPNSSSLRGALNAVDPTSLQSGIYNKLVGFEKTFAATGTLSPDAVTSIKKLASQMYNSQLTNYNSVRNATVTTLKNRGVTSADDYVTNYAASVANASNMNTTKSGKAFDYNAAKKAGYSDAKIQAWLNSN